MPDIFCHECGHEAQTANFDERFHRCPACNSDFCEVMGASPETTSNQQSEPQSTQQPQPQHAPHSSAPQDSPERDGGGDGDHTPNTMRHTTRFTLPNGHSYEVNFTTQVFQPGMEILPGMPPEGRSLQPNATGQTVVVLGDGGSGMPSNEALASLFSSMGTMPGNNARFSSADFGMGQSLESLLAQLAELHQVQEQPTAVEFRESLPRLKVPARCSPATSSAGDESNSMDGTPKPADVESPDTAAAKDIEVPALATADEGTAAKDAQVASIPAGGESEPLEDAAAKGVASCCAGDTCCVCRNEFKAGSEVIQLPCSHCFDEACIMPWLEMHCTCPVCRRKLPHEESTSDQAPSEAVAGGDPESVTPQRNQSSSRVDAPEAPSGERPDRREGSNGPLQSGEAGASNAGTEGNATIATAVMQQLASLVSGQLGQLGFAVPSDLAQQMQQQQPQQQQPQQQQPQQPQPQQQQQHQALWQGAPQLRLQMRMPFSAQASRAAPSRGGAHEQVAAAGSARQWERLNIERLVTELRRLQAQHQELQEPATEAQCQRQLAELRRLGATLQERLALVDTSYSAGSRQHDRLLHQVRAMREQVSVLRQRDEQSGNDADPDANSSSNPSELPAAVVRLLAFEDSLATAAGQLNWCRQSRQGLQENQRLINHHIAVFDRTMGQGGSVGHSSTAAHRVQPGSQSHSDGGDASSTEAAVSGAINSVASPSSAVRPASSPAEGDGGHLQNSRRVRARTDQGESLHGPDVLAQPRIAIFAGNTPPPGLLGQRSVRTGNPAAIQMAVPVEAEMVRAPQGDGQVADGSMQRPSGTVRPLHSRAPTNRPASPASRVSQGFSVPLHSVPGALGRLFGGLRGIFGRH